MKIAIGSDEAGYPLRQAEITIRGVRRLAQPNRFERVELEFLLHGLTQAQAGHVVKGYQDR